MINSERQQTNDRVIPVFGEHEIIKISGYTDETRDIFQLKVWSRSTISRVRSLNPGLLAIDGLNPNTEKNRVITFSPGNPLDLQQCVFVGADLDLSKYTGGSRNKESIFEAAMRRYWTGLEGRSVIDPNQENFTTRISEFIKEGVPELALLSLLCGLTAGISKLAGYESDLAQQIILYAGAA